MLTKRQKRSVINREIKQIHSLVASGLARVGLRSSPSKRPRFFLKELSVRFWGRYAAQRGQARSPQLISIIWNCVSI